MRGKLDERPKNDYGSLRPQIKTTTCWVNTKIYHYISYQIGPNRTGAQTRGGRSRPGLKTS